MNNVDLGLKSYITRRIQIPKSPPDAPSSRQNINHPEAELDDYVEVLGKESAVSVTPLFPRVDMRRSKKGDMEL